MIAVRIFRPPFPARLATADPAHGSQSAGETGALAALSIDAAQ
jgi:hypothetical protein